VPWNVCKRCFKNGTVDQDLIANPQIKTGVGNVDMSKGNVLVSDVQ
jgi:hypothetical protein